MSWETVKLGDIVKMVTGKTPPTKNIEYFNGEHLWVNPSDFGSKYITESKRTISQKAINEKKCNLLPIGTILLSCIGDIGKIGILKSIGSSNQQITGLITNDKVLPDYLYYYLMFNKSELENLANKAVVSILNNERLREFEVKLPSLATQKRIAEILDAADALRRKDQELLKKYDELAQAIFIDMFGDPVKNEKGWSLKTIKSTTNIITYGLTVRPKYIDSGIPLISARELRNGFVNYEGSPKISITDFKKLSNKCKPQKGDILFSKTGSIGLSAIVDGTQEFAVTQNAARINFKKEYYDIYFIYSLLRQESFINKCHSIVKGNAVKDLQLGDFSDINIICPPIEQQVQFSEMSLKSIGLVKTSKENCNFSDNLFKNLLQKAFKDELVN